MVSYTKVWKITVLVCISCTNVATGSVWKDKFYRRCQKIAISKDRSPEPPKSLLSMGHRLFKEKFVRNQRSYLDISGDLVRSALVVQVNNRSCPSDSEISRVGVMETCPTYTVLERDDNRIPSFLTQVKCRCLHCFGPWKDGTSRRCTPLFDLKYVFRVIGKRHGHKQYAVVREPQSYACACLKLSTQARFVMPP